MIGNYMSKSNNNNNTPKTVALVVFDKEAVINMVDPALCYQIDTSKAGSHNDYTNSFVGNNVHRDVAITQPVHTREINITEPGADWTIHSQARQAMIKNGDSIKVSPNVSATINGAFFINNDDAKPMFIDPSSIPVLGSDSDMEYDQ